MLLRLIILNLFLVFSQDYALQAAKEAQELFFVNKNDSEIVTASSDNFFLNKSSDQLIELFKTKKMILAAKNSNRGFGTPWNRQGRINNENGVFINFFVGIKHPNNTVEEIPLDNWNDIDFLSGVKKRESFPVLLKFQSDSLADSELYLNLSNGRIEEANQPDSPLIINNNFICNQLIEWQREELKRLNRDRIKITEKKDPTRDKVVANKKEDPNPNSDPKEDIQAKKQRILALGNKILQTSSLNEALGLSETASETDVKAKKRSASLLLHSDITKRLNFNTDEEALIEEALRILLEKKPVACKIDLFLKELVTGRSELSTDPWLHDILMAIQKHQEALDWFFANATEVKRVDDILTGKSYEPLKLLDAFLIRKIQKFFKQRFESLNKFLFLLSQLPQDWCVFNKFKDMFDMNEQFVLSFLEYLLAPLKNNDNHNLYNLTDKITIAPQLWNREANPALLYVNELSSELNPSIMPPPGELSKICELVSKLDCNWTLENYQQNVKAVNDLFWDNLPSNIAEVLERKSVEIPSKKNQTPINVCSNDEKENLFSNSTIKIGSGILLGGFVLLGTGWKIKNRKEAKKRAARVAELKKMYEESRPDKKDSNQSEKQKDPSDNKNKKSKFSKLDHFGK